MSGTRQKTLGEQLSQTLAAEGRGEALDAEAEDAEPLMAKPAPESPALAEQQLMEEVCDRGNLEGAWKRVRSNKGSPGVDGMTIDAAKDYLREHWPTIRTRLLEGTYHPAVNGSNPEAMAEKPRPCSQIPIFHGPPSFPPPIRSITGGCHSLKCWSAPVPSAPLSTKARCFRVYAGTGPPRLPMG